MEMDQEDDRSWFDISKADIDNEFFTSGSDQQKTFCIHDNTFRPGPAAPVPESFFCRQTHGNRNRNRNLTTLLLSV